MELFSFPGENSFFSSQTDAKTSSNTEAEVLTEEIEYFSRGMNTRPLKSTETQVELKYRKPKETSDVVAFISKVESLMSKELLKTSKAFQCNSLFRLSNQL